LTEYGFLPLLPLATDRKKLIVHDFPDLFLKPHLHPAETLYSALSPHRKPPSVSCLLHHLPHLRWHSPPPASLTPSQRWMRLLLLFPALFPVIAYNIVLRVQR